MIDLKQLMEERSANPPAQSALRFPQIRRRITTRNRRRVALVATVVAVALAIAGGYAGLPRQRVAPDPTTTTTTSPTISPPRPSEGFPPYQFGRKLVDQVSAPISSPEISITWKPTEPAAEAGFFSSELCSGMPKGVMLRGKILVNGHHYNNFLCSDFNSAQPARIEDWTRSAWIRPGEPITITYAIETAVEYQNNQENPIPMPNGGTISLGIYVPASFEEYRFPPRPDPLPGLASWADCPLDRFVRSDPGDPLRPMTVTMPWHSSLVFRWDTQTPGLMTFAIDGVKIATLDYWDYGNLNWSRSWNETEWAAIPGWKFPAEGAEVTITLTPEHFTGQWQVGLRNMESEHELALCQ